MFSDARQCHTVESAKVNLTLIKKSCKSLSQLLPKNKYPTLVARLYVEQNDNSSSIRTTAAIIAVISDNNFIIVLTSTA